MKDRLLILEGDATDRVQALETGSVQLVVTSPPYDNLRTYGGHSWDFERTAKELARVLCDGGVICWNVGDSVVDGSETLTSAKQKIFFREQCGLRVHDTMIYEKHNFSHPEVSRYHSVFEYIFVLSKGKPKTFNPIKDKSNATYGQTPFGKSTFMRPNGERFDRATQKPVSAEFGMRGNVWRGKTAGQENICDALPHPAMMPKWLAQDLILSWSNAGDTILDPFAGSGTTGKAAIELDCRAILIEVNPAYITLIEQRTTDITPGLPFTFGEPLTPAGSSSQGVGVEREAQSDSLGGTLTPKGDFTRVLRRLPTESNNNLPVPVLAEPSCSDDEPTGFVANGDGEARESTTGSRLGKPVTAQDSRGGQNNLSGGVESRHATCSVLDRGVTRGVDGVNPVNGHGDSHDSGSSAPPAQNLFTQSEPLTPAHGSSRVSSVSQEAQQSELKKG